MTPTNKTTKKSTIFGQREAGKKPAAPSPPDRMAYKADYKAYIKDYKFYQECFEEYVSQYLENGKKTQSNPTGQIIGQKTSMPGSFPSDPPSVAPSDSISQCKEKNRRARKRARERRRKERREMEKLEREAKAAKLNATIRSCNKQMIVDSVATVSCEKVRSFKDGTTEVVQGRMPVVVSDGYNIRSNPTPTVAGPLYSKVVKDGNKSAPSTAAPSSGSTDVSTDIANGSVVTLSSGSSAFVTVNRKLKTKTKRHQCTHGSTCGCA
jgi:hypothetical protein